MEQIIAFIILGLVTLVMGLYVTSALISDFRSIRLNTKIILILSGGGLLTLAIFLIVRAVQEYLLYISI